MASTPWARRDRGHHVPRDPGERGPPQRLGLSAKAVGKLVRTVRRVQADDEGRKRPGHGHARLEKTMVQATSAGVPARAHVVLAAADSAAFASLRQRSTSRRDRYRIGKELRRQVPRSSLGNWSAPADRPDPVRLITESHRGRLDWLIPVRVGRMAASPYGFMRGAAIVMAEDVARLPSTGITPVICGDSHMGNFGFYASPERDLVIDLNDFDEAHPGGWEWDLRRLVASIWVAGRQNGASEQECESAVLRCAAGYRDEVPGSRLNGAAGPVLPAPRRRPFA